MGPSLLAQTASSTHPDVAAIDRERVLKAADGALGRAPAPLTSIPAPRSPGTPHDFYSEAEFYWPDPGSAQGPYVLRSGARNPAAFSAHRDALLQLAMDVPALVAAFVLTREARYAVRAGAHLKAWFVEPATAMTPNMLFAQVIPPARAGRFEGVVEAVHLAEVAQSIAFLGGAEGLAEAELAGVRRWFADYFEWLDGSRLAGLARDDKSHHGSSWLLQASAFARLNEADDRPLTALGHRFKTSTIRGQILADGTFPHELTTLNPYRNSLFNLDMLAGVCLLLSTRFESVWDFELQDGPGMRAALARHYPFLRDRRAWPYPADREYFNDLPLRRPSLLFGARAYGRPEYAELWKRLPPDTGVRELQETLPIRQPLLWVTRPRP